MANSINWGKIYCVTHWGEAEDTIDSIPTFSAPACFVEDVLELSVDTTIAEYKVDTILTTVDQTQI